MSYPIPSCGTDHRTSFFPYHCCQFKTTCCLKQQLLPTLNYFSPTCLYLLKPQVISVVPLTNHTQYAEPSTHNMMNQQKKMHRAVDSLVLFEVPLLKIFTEKLNSKEKISFFKNPAGHMQTRSNIAAL